MHKWIDSDMLEVYIGRVPAQYEVLRMFGCWFKVGITVSGKTELNDVTDAYVTMEARA